VWFIAGSLLEDLTDGWKFTWAPVASRRCGVTLDPSAALKH
jgi:hypothetical protein